MASPTMSAALEVLLAEGVIDEVLGRLKSGKEADISLVRRGEEVLAAKVYKDRATRSFKNNVEYKEGRKVRNTRTQRAMDRGGKFGREQSEEAWKSAEVDALYKLSGAGVRVPTPVMFYEGVLLMELIRDAEGRPAPRMIDVAIEPAAAMAVYADLLVQMIAMLCADLVHGDLSPYNILAGADGPTIIDFPQVVSVPHSSRAEMFFLRDFDNIVRFVSGFDPALAIHRHDGRAIWRAYVARELTREFVPPPPPRAPDRRFDDRRSPRDDGRGPRDDGRGPRDNGWRSDNRGGHRPGPQGGNRPQRDNRPYGQGGNRPEGGNRFEGGNRPQGGNRQGSQGGERPAFQRGDRPAVQGGSRSSAQGENRPGSQRTRPNPSSSTRPGPPQDVSRGSAARSDRRSDPEAGARSSYAPSGNRPGGQGTASRSEGARSDGARSEGGSRWPMPVIPTTPPAKSRGGRRRPKRHW